MIREKNRTEAFSIQLLREKELVVASWELLRFSIYKISSEVLLMDLISALHYGEGEKTRVGERRAELCEKRF